MTISKESIIYKKTEEYLKEYRSLNARIQALEMFLDFSKNEFNIRAKNNLINDGITAINYDHIKVSKTNRITSLVENIALENAEYHSTKIFELNQKKLLKNQLENSIKALSEIESKVISFKYMYPTQFSNIEIARTLEITEQSVSKIKRKAIKKIAGLIFD